MGRRSAQNKIRVPEKIPGDHRGADNQGPTFSVGGEKRKKGATTIDNSQPLTLNAGDGQRYHVGLIPPSSPPRTAIRLLSFCSKPAKTPAIRLPSRF